jgi:hypothetical protein
MWAVCERSGTGSRKLDGIQLSRDDCSLTAAAFRAVAEKFGEGAAVASGELGASRRERRLGADKAEPTGVRRAKLYERQTIDGRVDHLV